MITAYTAAPVKIHKMDFAKIGSGTGALRYTFGLYCGEAETAKHYLDQYNGTTFSDKSYRVRGSSLEIESGTISYKVCEALCDANQDYDLVRANFEDDESALSVIEYIEDAGGVDVQYGTLYKLEIPGHNIDSVNNWTDLMSIDLINEAAIKYHSVKPEALKNIVAAAETLGVELGEEKDDVSYILDCIFEAGFEYGSEEGDIGYSADIDDYKEVWDAMIRGDTYTDYDCEADFNDEYPQDYIATVKTALGNDFPSLEAEFTYEDVYCVLSSAFNPDVVDQLKNIQGKKVASDFFSKELGIELLVANSMYGRPGAKELLILSESLANEVKLSLEDPRGDLSYGFNSDLDKLNIDDSNELGYDDEYRLQRSY